MLVTIDGRSQEILAGERLIDLINRSRNPDSPGLLSPAARPDPDLRHLHGRGGRQAGAGLRDAGRRRHEGASQRRRAQTRRSARPSTASSAIICSTARSATTTTATARSTTRPKLLGVEHQQIPFKPKPYEVDITNPFYRYDPDQCILCGRCVEACQNLQVNETLSHPLGGPASARACGTAARPSANRVASPAAIASRSAPAMR